MSTTTTTREVVLISTYEMGRQPFGLASPAAWLTDAGARVTLVDLSVEDLDTEVIANADLVGFYLPMHTATRLAAPVISRVRSINPTAHIAAFGLYAPLNAGYLRELGVDTVISGEFEEALVCLLEWPVESTTSNGSGRLVFRVPDRSGLPGLESYARLQTGTGKARTVGYTEASRGCKHLCRHCPVVPVYEGRFHVVSPEIVLADIANQVAAGAEHVTFGDPDFFNGPAHAMRVVRGLHEAHPRLTYDVTIKVQHLVDHLDLIPVLAETGCAFVTSAVESFDDHVLTILDKRHTPGDLARVLEAMDRVGLPLAPTFVAFTPWTTLEGYGTFLESIRDMALVDAVAPIQYAIRLLLPEGSLLLDLPDVAAIVAEFDRTALVYPWQHPDPRVDRLQEAVLDEVGRHQGHDRRQVFARVWEVAREHGAVEGSPEAEAPAIRPQVTIPYLTEPWYC